MYIAVLVLAVLQLVSAAVNIDSIKQLTSSEIVENAFIVELKTGTHLKRGFDSPHQELYHDLQRRKASLSVRAEYTSEILTGVAIQLGSSADLPKLAEVASVQSIFPITRVPGPPSPIIRVLGPQSMEKGGPVNTAMGKDYFPPHIMTGVDKAHAENYTGAGVTVGIIDSGLDYTHVLFGGKIGPGNKILGGHDFVGDNFTGTDGSIPVPDDDFLDQCGGHGTYVAGILGANPGGPYNISGVAYGASLNIYRVFGCAGNRETTTDVLISAFVRAQADNNDIINMSVGIPTGWAQRPLGIVVNRIAARGKIITLPVGNEGEHGAWYSHSPGNGVPAISVGSVDNTLVYIQNATVSNGRLIPYSMLTPIQILPGLPLYATSPDITNPADACGPLPSNTPDLSKYLVIIRRGTCDFGDKLDNAAAFGAKYFVIYNNIDETLDIPDIDMFVAYVSQQDGIFLVQKAIPQHLTISFTDLQSTLVLERGGLMSSFSSYGPTYETYLEPTIAAPGGWIPTTYPVPLGMYISLSGTSGASPFAAGAAALLLQAHGKSPETVRFIRTILQNTAAPVKETKASDSLIDTSARQGAGLLQVYDAIKSTARMYPSELLLNDTLHFKGSHLLRITNLGKQSVTYTFSHVPAGTANTISGIEANRGPVPLVPNAAGVRIIPPKLIVPAGFTLATFVTFTPPGGLSSSNFPVYTGYIVATAASLKDMKILDDTPVSGGAKFPALVDGTGEIVSPGNSLTYTMSDTNAPGLIFRLAAGTALLRLDLADSNVQVHINRRSSNHGLEKRADSGELDTPFPIHPGLDLPTWDSILPDLHSSGKTFGDVKTLGLLSQSEYVPRDNSDFTPKSHIRRFKKFANGTEIPDGKYKILLWALRITGNPARKGDYETWESPAFVVKRN
ncbi:Minor extracellular protease vpr [Ceratobasidium theobromae]|uniref:Minor extracellular protease vpr n=1 Tax=Ceratobasidium theobromae TaxID=1582974 RepID=A0A5N5QF32_9AGAM|nr:Minor extracellular protease vpr [Ceratobasidium theobromae]